MISRFLTGVAMAVLMSISSAFADDAKPSDRANTIAFKADMVYPESMSWSARHSAFFVGSVRFGTIGTVDGAGHYKPFVTDRQLVSTVGVLVDDRRDRVLVANSDPGAGAGTDGATVGKLAGVGVYDMTSGKRLAYHDLGALKAGAHFANDLALDDKGNIYVTDSFAPVIYKIDTSGQASIFLEDARFHTVDGFNLNGIAYHPDGFLLVGKYNSGELFRIGLANKTIEKVALASPLVGADGFSLMSSGKLLVAVNAGADKAVELTSTDGWRSAEVSREVKSIQSMPTAVAKVDKDVWLLNSRLDTLLDPKARKVGDYLLQKL